MGKVIGRIGVSEQKYSSGNRREKYQNLFNISMQREEKTTSFAWRNETEVYVSNLQFRYKSETAVIKINAGEKTLCGFQSASLTTCYL